MALLDLILGTNYDFSCFGVTEQEHLLCGKGYHENRDIVFEYLAVGDL